MTDRDQVPALLVRIDNLVRVNATLATELQEEHRQRALIESHLANIERALAIPLAYNVRQAAQRLNRSIDWCYRHLPKHVTPVSQDPLQFPIDQVDRLALAIQERSSRKAAGE